MVRALRAAHGRAGQRAEAPVHAGPADAVSVAHERALQLAHADAGLVAQPHARGERCLGMSAAASAAAGATIAQAALTTATAVIVLAPLLSLRSWLDITSPFRNDSWRRRAQASAQRWLIHPGDSASAQAVAGGTRSQRLAHDEPGAVAAHRPSGAHQAADEDRAPQSRRAAADRSGGAGAEEGGARRSNRRARPALGSTLAARCALRGVRRRGRPRRLSVVPLRLTAASPG